MEVFDHERLDVYHRARDFVKLADEIAQLTEGRADLGDQLRRASFSIMLNIAEGAGEFSKKEKARFYRMALRSATERAAVVDICTMLEIGVEPQRLAARAMLLRIVGMLVRLVRSVGEGIRRESGTGTGMGTGTGKKET